MSHATLYHYWRSSASWRARWGLALKKVPHDKIAINLLVGEEKSADFLAVNPSGYLPAYVQPGKPVLAESIAFLEWLEEEHPSPSFFFGDSFDRALIRRLAETINSGTQPLVNLDVTRRHSLDSKEQTSWSRHWIERGLSVYETLLDQHSQAASKFSVCDYPTLADICLIPQCYSAKRIEVDLSKFPRIKTIYETALATKECSESAPDKFEPK